MAAEDAPAPAEVVVVADVPPVVEEKELPPATEEKVVAGGEEDKAKEEVKEEKDKEEGALISSSVSFKEETNVVGELPDAHKKALDELKQLVQEALEKHEFTAPPPPPPAKEVEEEKKAVVAEEEPKKEEETKKEEEVVTEEEKPAEAAKKKEVVAEEPAPPPAAEAKEEATVVAEEATVEKAEAVVGDDDGAKTVEAIKETIVEVAASAVKTEEEPAAPTPEPAAEPEVVQPVEPEEVSIWGVPLLKDERSDVVLLKFLRARDFKPKEAFAMIKSTVRWRKEFGIESLVGEDLEVSGLEEVVYMHGTDKEGHPVCYNQYGELGRMYETADEEKRKKFLKWRVQFMEKTIEKYIDFSPTGVCTFVQVNDLKNSPGLLRREIWTAINKGLQLLQDNYPEFVAKQVFLNVPWWYLLFNKMMSPFLTQRTKSKFLFAAPSRTSETLFRYIAPELVPVQYGGLSRDGENEFSLTDPVTEVTLKPALKHTVEFPVSETGEVVWELRVVGCDVVYGAEFVPAAEGSYTVIVTKANKLSASDEPIICNSFIANEPGKVVITVHNSASKKKKILLYRSKTKPVA